MILFELLFGLIALLFALFTGQLLPFPILMVIAVGAAVITFIKSFIEEQSFKAVLHGGAAYLITWTAIGVIAFLMLYYIVVIVLFLLLIFL
jgi:hypothetical protein